MALSRKQDFTQALWLENSCTYTLCYTHILKIKAWRFRENNRANLLYFVPTIIIICNFALALQRYPWEIHPPIISFLPYWEAWILSWYLCLLLAWWSFAAFLQQCRVQSRCLGHVFGSDNIVTSTRQVTQVCAFVVSRNVLLGECTGLGVHWGAFLHSFCLGIAQLGNFTHGPRNVSTMWDCCEIHWYLGRKVYLSTNHL